MHLNLSTLVCIYILLVNRNFMYWGLCCIYFSWPLNPEFPYFQKTKAQILNRTKLILHFLNWDEWWNCCQCKYWQHVPQKNIGNILILHLYKNTRNIAYFKYYKSKSLQKTKQNYKNRENIDLWNHFEEWDILLCCRQNSSSLDV